MAIRTYYHILGVSRDATQEEITNAKNALAKVYHPDANIRTQTDTTARMQEILEAYRILSDPERRRRYDQELGGGKRRVFRTYTVGEPGQRKRKGSDSFGNSFVEYWNAAVQLNDAVKQSKEILEKEGKMNGFSLIGKLKGMPEAVSPRSMRRLEELAIQALKHITLLKTAGISSDYWQPETMNWLLIHWGQNQTTDLKTLFAKYDAFMNSENASEKHRLKAKTKRFQRDLKKLLAYAI